MILFTNSPHFLIQVLFLCFCFVVCMVTYVTQTCLQVSKMSAFLNVTQLYFEKNIHVLVQNNVSKCHVGSDELKSHVDPSTATKVKSRSKLDGNNFVL